jgi:hypothetical protein
MAISEVKNLNGGAVHYSHVKLLITFKAYFLCEILNLGGLGPLDLLGQYEKLCRIGCKWLVMVFFPLSTDKNI